MRYKHPRPRRVTRIRKSCRISRISLRRQMYPSGQRLLAWARSKSGQPGFSPSKVLAAFRDLWQVNGHGRSCWLSGPEHLVEPESRLDNLLIRPTRVARPVLAAAGTLPIEETPRGGQARSGHADG